MNGTEIKETKSIENLWELPAYNWKVETSGLRLFVDGLKEGKILGRKCSKCGTVYVPGPKFCRKCIIDIDEVLEIKKEGRIGAFTVNLADIRGNPLPEINIVCCVKLDGSDTYLMGNLKGWSEWKDVKAGMRVKVVLKENRTGALADMEGFELIK